MFTTREFADRPAPRGPRLPRRWLLAAAAAVLVLVIALAVVAGIRNRTTDSESTATTDPGTAATATPPRDLEWKLINGVRLPFSADGPARVEGPRASGYTHTPQGALIAAWQISTRVLTDTRYEQLLGTQVRADLGQQQQVRNSVTKVRNMSSEEFDAAFRQPTAFQFVTYTPTFARIYFAVPSNKGGYDFQRRAVLWDGTDWVYQVDSGLPELPNSTGLKGFTTF